MAASKGCTENEINLTTEIQKIRETNFYIVATHMFVSYISLTSQNHKKNTHTHTHQCCSNQGGGQEGPDSPIVFGIFLLYKNKWFN